MNKILAQLSDNMKNKLEKSEMDRGVSPMLATLTEDYFSDPDWIYERKLDGERCLIYKKNNNVELISRNQKSQNQFYPELVKALKDYSGDFILDGELVVFDGKLTSFTLLQNRMHVKNPSEKLLKAYPVIAYIFDILYLDEYTLEQLPLRKRKYILKQALKFSPPLRFLPHRNEKGGAYLQEACSKGWEGIIAKDASASYIHSRSKKWLKFKCIHQQEFVIGGYTEPKGERLGFGSLLIGYYEQKKLKYAGKVGTGFTDDFLKWLSQKMQKIENSHCPFSNYDESDNREVTWIKPELVGEIGFTEWTDDNKLRHPRFLGLRKDKSPEKVHKEGS